TASYYFVGKNKTFAFDTTLPFGMNQRQQNAWIHWGGGLQLVREFMRDFNVISFPAGNTGTQMGGWFRKEVKKVSDLKGLKMRIAGLGGDVMARLGAVPQQIAGGDIYPALERGVIDAAEWVGPYDDEKLGFYKVAPFYYYPGWWEGGPQIDFFINTQAYERLSAEYKAIVEAACAVAHIDMQARYDAKNPAALKSLVKAGVKVLPFPKPVLDEAFKQSMQLYDELSSRNPNWKKVYDDYSAFRREQNLWFRFAEASFDRYMQSVKL
ncbi:MAG: TRAP transporter substrate-binding protein DctP, partial [Burkholderiales bacterium]